MYIDLDSHSSLQPFVEFDWRLVAERGLRQFGHFHVARNECKSVASCEINFLRKVSNEENQKHRHELMTSCRQEAEAEVEAARGAGSSATRRAGQFKCVGAIRKAGFLSVKKWILKRKQSIELARKQGWKRYWVCLRGTALLFHSVIDRPPGDNGSSNQAAGAADELQTKQTDLLSWIQSNCGNQMRAKLLADQEAANLGFDLDAEGLADKDLIERNMSQCYIEREPRHLIIIDGAVAQPIPEHPKRDFVFCLSTTFGDAYLFQASCQLESDNWISAIHNACAASIARDLTRDEAVKLFETKIRQLELEAEKKLFLKQRLESRLTSMSSMSHLSSLMGGGGGGVNPTSGGNQRSKSFRQDVNNGKLVESQDTQSKRTTMRSLLQRLNQQLLTLDNYLEQLHCEVYQLRCYLSSCELQMLFNPSGSVGIQSTRNYAHHHLPIELPHPKSLLMHVSNATKLLLIKMGVFTVSSLHAYIHARHGSAESILQKIQASSSQLATEEARNFPGGASGGAKAPVELLVRSTSVSENLASFKRNIELENDTEELIHMANLRSVLIRVQKCLFNRIRNQDELKEIILPEFEDEQNESDDRHSFHSEGQFVIINLKLHLNTNCLSIIKQVLTIITAGSSPTARDLNLTSLEYYLKFVTNSSSQEVGNDELPEAGDSQDDSSHFRQVANAKSRRSSLQYVARRRDNLSDWSNFDCLQLMEKIVYRVDLVRSRIDEEAAPFGISIVAQLFSNNFKSLLNVFCSYIEWGSVADKAGLKDDDEFLVINGVPVADLDMMFIECIIRDESKLQLVVRSSRGDCPPGAIALDKLDWSKPSRDRKDKDDDEAGGRRNLNFDYFQTAPRGGPEAGPPGGSKVISDEYISSLVCPPPPTTSKAFLRTDSSLLRQKSDLTSAKQTSFHADCPSVNHEHEHEHEHDDDEDDDDRNGLPLMESLKIALDRTRAKSQENLEALADDQSAASIGGLGEQPEAARSQQGENNDDAGFIRAIEADNKLTQSAGWTCDVKKAVTSSIPSQQPQTIANPNLIERLRKSIIELLETEYGFIKHLETCHDIYLIPLKEMSFLSIGDLKQLNSVVLQLIHFQKDFFQKLTDCCANQEDSSSSLATTTITTTLNQLMNDDFEIINKIVFQLDSMDSVEEFSPILSSIAKTFNDQADRFKVYAIYCASYSKLQKLLHPKRGQVSGFNSNSIASVPNNLDTFQNSSVLGLSSNININSSHHHREFLKPLGSFITTTNNDPGLQLKQLNDFLGNLDSSSSSVSVSLSKCSSSNTIESISKQQKSAQTTATTAPTLPPAATSGVQKCAHQQNFESYLIKPIQRIVKYPMLLNSILSSAQHLSQQDESLHLELKTAAKRMQSVANYVNESQKTFDEYGTIFELIERQYLEQVAELTRQKVRQQQSLISGPRQPNVSLSIEQLLYFGPVDWLNIHEFTSKLKKNVNLTQTLFVFSSCVVFICREQSKPAKRKNQTAAGLLPSNQTTSSTFNNASTPKRDNLGNLNNNELSSGAGIIRYQSLIPVSEVLVRSVASGATGESNTSAFQWELFRCSSVNSNSSLLTKRTNKRNSDGKIYFLLSCETNESRNNFLRKIRFIIRESVQNMSLPLARCPSSKTSTPRKLSSPTSNTTITTTNTTTNSSCSQSTSLSPSNRKESKLQQTAKNGSSSELAGAVVINSKPSGNSQVKNNFTSSIKVNY